ncbi:hypothetical protein [Streptomyces zaomyceticus]|uniref:hypothetical protein n=1 Tax=Streptomyces zaomyceticus TaxID=68286 RepID=UPI0036A480BF
MQKAEDIGGFVQPYEDSTPVISTIPGGGWPIDCIDGEGSTWTDPIMAWSIQADGTANPIQVDSDGLTDDATTDIASYRT